MLRALGLVLTTALLFGMAACTSADRQANVSTADNRSARLTNTPTPAITPTPAPSAASVKGIGAGPPFKWTDAASGTNVTTIKVGESITWTAEGNHKLASDPSTPDNGCGEIESTPSFDSTKIVDPVTRKFTKAGTFGYHCGVHGGTPNCKDPTKSKGMSGVIKVMP